MSIWFIALNKHVYAIAFTTWSFLPLYIDTIFFYSVEHKFPVRQDHALNRILLTLQSGQKCDGLFRVPG